MSSISNKKFSMTNVDDKTKTKKFVGGAEMARRRAQKKKRRGIPIVAPTEREQLNAALPRSTSTMSSMERFFAAFLQSPAVDFLVTSSNSSAPQSNAAASLALWETICRRLGGGMLSALQDPVMACYSNPKLHFAVRASLVLEEARHSLSEGLQQLWMAQKDKTKKNQFVLKQQKNNSRKSMRLCLKQTEPTKHNQHSKWTFVNKQKQLFTKEQLYELRPGTVFHCLPRNTQQKQQQSPHHIVWGVIASGQRDSIETQQSFSLLVCRPSALEDEEDWIVTPVASLITDLRCFEAMTKQPQSIPFCEALLGGKGRTHVRFDESGNAQPVSNEESDGDYDSSCEIVTDSTASGLPKPTSASGLFRMPTLNPAQQKAADSFLSSSPQTITLVQGPPGTGKTTLLVSVICQYLEESCTPNLVSGQDDDASWPVAAPSRRLLVCAPTNKAVSVLASRFCEALHPDAEMNVLLVGDAEKLLTDSRQHPTTKSSKKISSSRKDRPKIEGRSLQTTFLYTWTATLADEYRQIRDAVAGGHGTDLGRLARRLQSRLTTALPKLLPKDMVLCAKEITSALQGKLSGSKSARASLVGKIDDFIEQINDLPTDQVWKELMSSAQVIFCTLAAAGGMVFKNTRKVDDLIVDEAAASTEPELYIPFHLRPSRLLGVGDPKQLPATVLSPRATALGLSRSLHERLMYDCDTPHTLLDVQYRMHPDISVFPSLRFYQSRVGNGANVCQPREVNSTLLFDGEPYSFLQVNGREENSASGSHCNLAEAQTVVDLVCELRRRCSSTDTKWYTSDHIRVITFYQAQVALIKQLLRKAGLCHIVVATVDSSQGCEANITLVSFVRSPSSRRVGNLTRRDAGFLTDDRRMNVALTRAKHQMIGIGNIAALQQMVGAETLQRLAENALERSAVRPYLTARDKATQKNLAPLPPTKKLKTGN